MELHAQTIEKDGFSQHANSLAILTGMVEGEQARQVAQKMLTDKELELFRYSIAGLSSKSVSVIIKESPQNIYQIKSRLLKKVRRNSEELWSRLNMIW